MSDPHTPHLASTVLVEQAQKQTACLTEIRWWTKAVFWLLFAVLVAAPITGWVIYSTTKAAQEKREAEFKEKWPALYKEGYKP